MNTVAQSFKRLTAVVRHLPESNSVDVYAADLATKLAQLREHKACLACICERNQHTYQGFQKAIPILKDYGVILTKREHPNAIAYFIFAELVDEEPSPYANAAVLEAKAGLLELAA